MKTRIGVGGWVAIVVSLLVLCAFGLLPVLWGVSTSFKPESEVYSIPPRWIPEHFSLENYAAVFSNASMAQYFLNTTIISAGTTVISVFVAILAAYGFSRYRFPGRGTLLWSILFTRMLPRVTLLVPLYIFLKNLGMVNTYGGLILIYTLVVMPISVWLLKAFFDNLPYEIEEAAVMDGCSPVGVLFRIIMPISLPAIVSIAMNAFILSWNEFLFALVMTNGKAIRPVSVGLAFYIDELGVHWGPLMAASLLMSIPAILIFMIFQKQLVRGLSEGGVKG